MGPETLAQVLRPLENFFKAQDHPALLVGLDAGDDAAVYRLTEDIAVIQTLDFFTPVVDDPYDYGTIAAANSMNDVYAMGGDVVLALNICAFPKDMELNIITEILRGGAEKVAEAGAVLAGGHTILDKEPKYGLSVMGTVHPDSIMTEGGARSGDILILTKALGVGIITTAAKGKAAHAEHISQATENMARLNRRAAEICRQFDVRGCTDITGFALLGHGCEMAERSAVMLRIEVDKLPFLPGAKEYAREGLIPGGTFRNQRCYQDRVRIVSSIAPELETLLFTPETSGGLLAAIDPRYASEFVSACNKAGQDCWVIGEVVDGSGIEII